MSKKLRIAWFSPTNIDRIAGHSIAAYFTDIIVPLLIEQFEIEIFKNDFTPYLDLPTHHFLRAAERHQQQPFDLFFYQVEDIEQAQFCRIHLALQPGVVLFHDFCMRTFGPEPILNSPWQQTVDFFNGSRSAWPARAVDHPQSGPYAFREAAFAKVALFSNPAAHTEYKRTVSRRLDAEAPLFSSYLPLPAALIKRTPDSGIEKNLILCSGVNIEHRTHKILEALSSVALPYRLQWLVASAEQSRAEELLREFSISSAEIIVGRSPAAWTELISRADCALHPLFSVHGQLGPYLELSLRAGLPSVVTRFNSTELLPDDLLFKVLPGEHEAYQIREIILALLDNRIKVDHDQLMSYANELFNPEMIAAELARIFVNCSDGLSDLRSRWTKFTREARQSLRDECEQCIPLFSPAQDNPISNGAACTETILNPLFEEFNW